MVLPGLGLAIVVVVYLMFKRPSGIERTANYRVGDTVLITHQGELKTGKVKGIAQVEAGQLLIERAVTIGVKWFDGQGTIHRYEVKMPVYQIRGRMTRLTSANLRDTSWHFAQEKWLTRGPQKERVR